MNQNNSGDYQWQNDERTQKMDGYNDDYSNDYNNDNYNGYNNYGNYNNSRYRTSSNRGGTNNIIMIFVLIFLCIVMLGFIIVGIKFIGKDINKDNPSVTQAVKEKNNPGKKKVMYIASNEDEVDFLKDPDNSEENVIGSIPIGSKVMLIKNENESYAFVEYNKISGYVERKFLTEKKPGNSVEDSELEEEEEILERTPEPVETEAPTPSSDVVTKYVYVANVAYSIYLRSTPYETNNVICEIPVGTKVGYIGAANGAFSKIKYGSYVGYSKTQYLSNYPPTAVSTPSSDVVTKYVYVANVAYSIYLRSTPYETNNVICEIPVGTKVGYIGPANGTFSKIKYGSYVGYSKTQYLSNYAPSAPSSSSKYMTVCNVAYSIYLRSAPVENSSNIICEIPVGSKVEFIDSGNGTFYKIRWNGNVGYSKSAYLR